MKLKFFIAGVAIVAGLASAVSCQDISKDLTALQDKVKSLESTVQALQSKIDAGAVITSVTPSNSGIKITLSNGNSYEITNGVNGKDGTNGKDGADGTPGSVVTIGDNGNWFIDGVDTGLAAQGPQGEQGPAGQDAAPADYYTPESDGYFYRNHYNTETGEWEKTKTDIYFITPGTITAVYNTLTGTLTLHGVVDENGDVIDVTFTIGGGVSPEEKLPEGAMESADVATGANGWSAVLNAYEVALKTVDQVENDFHGMTFVAKDKAEVPVYANIMVTPADAVLEAEDIQFVDSNDNVLSMVKAIKVEKNEQLVTKAEASATWKVTYAIDVDSYDKEAFLKAIFKNPAKKPDPYTAGNRVAFAMKAGKASTDYIFLFKPLSEGTDKASLIGANTKVNGNNASTYYNLGADQIWLTSKKGYETPATKTVGDGIDPKTSNWENNDNRSVLKPAAFAAELDEAFTVSIDGAAGIWVELDIEKTTDPSEKVAWEKYADGGIEGLGLHEGSTASITVTDPAAKGDYIVFRVSAVNASGTLMDPDGIAFAVVVGKSSSEEWSDLSSASFVPKYYGSYGKGTDQGEKVAYVGKKLTGASKMTLETEYDVAFGITFYDAKDAPVGKVATDGTFSMPADWSAVAKAAAYSVDGLDKNSDPYTYQSFVDNEEYSGTVTIMDANDFVLATFDVTVKKVLPTDAPAFIKKAFIMKSGALDDNGCVAFKLVGTDNTSAPVTAATTFNKARNYTGAAAPSPYPTSSYGKYASTDASDKVAKATAGWEYYEWQILDETSLKMSDLFYLKYDAKDLDKVEEHIRTTFVGAQRFYLYSNVDKPVTARMNPTGTERTSIVYGSIKNGGLEDIQVYGFNKVSGVEKNVGLGIGAANKSGKALVEYNYGKISATSKNGVVTKGGEYYVELKDKSFKYSFTSTLGDIKDIDWDWNVLNALDATDGWNDKINTIPVLDHNAAGADWTGTSPRGDWSVTAPNHNARVWYAVNSNTAGFTPFTETWLPVKVDGKWDRTWDADTFDIHTAPALDYSGNVTLGSFTAGKTTIVKNYIAGYNAKGERKSLAQLGTGIVIVPGDKYWWGGKDAQEVKMNLVSSNGIENEYYTPTKNDNISLTLTKGTASKPINNVEMTLNFSIRDEFDQEVTLSKKVKIVVK